MSLAAEAREAVRKRPAVHRALRAGVVNYRAAAEELALDGDPEAVATALRRYAAELDPPATRRVDAPVRMQRGVGLEPAADAGRGGDGDHDAGGGGGDVDVDVDAGGGDGGGESPEVVVAVGDRRVVRGGDMTAVRAAGDVDAGACRYALDRLDAASVVVGAAGVVGGELVVVVPRRQGATALRVVEDALSAVPA
jgi:hypothetical protein